MSQQAGVHYQLALVDSIVTNTGLSVVQMQSAVDRHSEPIAVVGSNLRLLGERQELERRFAALRVGHAASSTATPAPTSPTAAFATPSATPTAAATSGRKPSLLS